MNKKIRILMAVFLVFFTLFFYSCCAFAGGGGFGDRYVNAVTGDDTSGDGSFEHPYKTITKALIDPLHPYQLRTVHVAPGVYNAAAGEVFPIHLSANVSLIGDIDNKGNGTIQTLISGAGDFTSPTLGGTYSAAILGNNYSTLSGFTITATSGAAVWCDADSFGCCISSNTIQNSIYGVVIAGNTAVHVGRNDIALNSTGVDLFSGSLATLRDNNLNGNGYGIIIQDTSNPDIGNVDDFGNNTITSNTVCDLCNRTANTINAFQNVWDDDPFLFSAASSCTGGANIANEAGGAVLYQFIPLSGSPIFAGTANVPLLLPSDGTLIANTAPLFQWQSTGEPYVVACLSIKPLLLVNHRIQNKNDIIWIWHSGLSSGSDGLVNFTEGKTVSQGEIIMTPPPSALSKGRTYYWAVWAWDETATRVTDSSKMGYFTELN